MRASHAGAVRLRGRSVPADTGSAVLEFIVVGVGVLVPLVYLALCASTVHAAAFASTQAVREAGRAFSTAATPEQGRARAEAAARLALADQGLSLPRGALRVSCPVAPCLAPGSFADVTLEWSVPLPWLPAALSGDAPSILPISATHRVPIDDYRSSPEPAP